MATSIAQAPQPEELEMVRRNYAQYMPVPDEMWAVMSGVLVPQEVAKGDYWLEAGQVCNWVGFIIKGLTKTSYIRDGQDVVADFANASMFVTEYASFVSQRPSKMSIQALEDCRVLGMSYASLQQLYSLGPNAERMGRLIAEWLYVAFLERVMSLQVESPEERYHLFTEQYPQLMQRIPLYMIASYLGITPESLSRIRARIARRARA
jgi:CRP-like cAMP-binding protein